MGGPGSYTWIDLDSLSIPPRSTICLEIRFSTSPDKGYINLNRFLKKTNMTIPSYTEQSHDGRPRFDKFIRYFIDFQNRITKENNFQNVRALDRKILLEHYGYLSHQCINWVRIWIRFDISIFSFIMSTTRITRGLGTSLYLNISTNQEPDGFLLLPARARNMTSIRGALAICE